MFDIFLIFAQNIDCRYTLAEPPRRGGSNEYPQSMFWSKNKKKSIPLHTPVLLYKNGGVRGYTFHEHVVVTYAHPLYGYKLKALSQPFLLFHLTTTIFKCSCFNVLKSACRTVVLEC